MACIVNTPEVLAASPPLRVYLGTGGDGQENVLAAHEAKESHRTDTSAGLFTDRFLQVVEPRHLLLIRHLRRSGSLVCGESSRLIRRTEVTDAGA